MTIMTPSNTQAYGTGNNSLPIKLKVVTIIQQVRL